MTDSSDRGSEPGPPERVSASASANDVTVEKLVARQRDGSVAVRLTIRSARTDPVEVRVIDRLPEPFPDDAIDLHPDADPDRLRPADGAVVYETTAAPGSEQTTAYRVRVEGPPQLERFATEPTLEVGDFDVIFDYWADDGRAPRAGAGTTGGSPANDGAGRAPAAAGSGDRTPTGRATWRDSSDVDASALDRRLRSLRADVDALREAVESNGGAGGDLGRIESQVDGLADSIDERFQSLTAELESLTAEVERGARWRQLVQEAVEYDPSDG